MSELHKYIIDVESSGLNPLYHEMTEISVIRVSDKVQISRNIKCRYPERSSLDSLRITNKTMADLKNGDDSLKVVNDINAFLAQDGATDLERCIIAHNANFDVKFCNAMWQNCGSFFPFRYQLCTWQMSKFFLKKIGETNQKSNLNDICDFFKIKKYANAHSAKTDTRHTYHLYQKLINESYVDILNFIKPFENKPKEEAEELIDFSNED